MVLPAVSVTGHAPFGLLEICELPGDHGDAFVEYVKSYPARGLFVCKKMRAGALFPEAGAPFPEEDTPVPQLNRAVHKAFTN